LAVVCPITVPNQGRHTSGLYCGPVYCEEKGHGLDPEAFGRSLYRVVRCWRVVSLLGHVEASNGAGHVIYFRILRCNERPDFSDISVIPASTRHLSAGVYKTDLLFGKVSLPAVGTPIPSLGYMRQRGSQDQKIIEDSDDARDLHDHAASLFTTYRLPLCFIHLPAGYGTLEQGQLLRHLRAEWKQTRNNNEEEAKGSQT
jgi:hypothetical protein